MTEPPTDKPEDPETARIIAFDPRKRPRDAAKRRAEQPKKLRRQRLVVIGNSLIVLTIVALFLLTQCGVGPRAAEWHTTAHAFERGEVISSKVTSIVDGDGLRLSNGLEVRLGDFNSPEWNEPGGREAKRALSRIALGENVECTYCEGARHPGHCTSYDRIIATCRLAGKRLGDLMRAQGLAEGGR